MGENLFWILLFGFIGLPLVVLVLSGTFWALALLPSNSKFLKIVSKRSGYLFIFLSERALHEFFKVLDIADKIKNPLGFTLAVLYTLGALLLHFQIAVDLLRPLYPNLLLFFFEFGWQRQPDVLIKLFLMSGALGYIAGFFFGFLLAFLKCLFDLYIGLLGIFVLVFGWERRPDLYANPRDVEADAHLILCQLSDIHMTANGKVPYEIEEGEAHWPQNVPQPDTEELVSRTQQLAEAINEMSPTLVVVTGDVTDLGHEEQWVSVERGLSRLHAINLMIVPGNHDIEINKGIAPDVDGAQRSDRQKHFISALGKLERGDIQPQLKSKHKTLNELFPRQITIENGIRVFGLDSNRIESHFVATNAIGLLTNPQLDLFSKQLNDGSGPVIVLMHHHATRPVHWSVGTDPFMVAMDGHKLLRRLCEYQRRDRQNIVLLLHGHKHLDFFGRYSHRGGEVHVYGHPSSTMGHEIDGTLDGLPRFASVSLSKDRLRWIVQLHSLQPKTI